MHLPYRVNGGWLWLNALESVSMGLRAVGLYEREKARALRAVLRPGDVMIDVGANHGYFTMLAAQRVGPSGGVLAVEPHAENCAWIERSVRWSGYKHVTVCPAAAWHEEAKLELHLGRRSGWHTLRSGHAGRSEGTVEVRGVPLDKLVLERYGGRCRALKIDVEGAELDVLRGAQRVLQACRPVMLMDLHPQLGANPLEVRDLLAGLGYTGMDAVDANAQNLVAWPPENG